MNIAEEQSVENPRNSNPEEDWRPVFLYEGYYEVSNLGRIRNIKRNKLLGASALGGYMRIVLRKEGMVSRTTVHAVVARAFLGERPEGWDVNHKHGIKNDNRASELEYMTKSQNVLHAYRTGLKHPASGERNGCSRLTNIMVLEIRRLYESGQYTQKALALLFGVAPNGIRRVVRRIGWTHI